MNPNYFIKENEEKIKHLFIKTVNESYGYFYLTAMHKLIQYTPADSIAVGVSYGNSLLTENHFKGGLVKFCKDYQDVYYDFLNLKRAVENSASKIKRCFCIWGYWSIAYDISSGKTKETETRRSIEYTLFKDPHHWKNPCDIWGYVRDTFENPGEFSLAVDFIESLMLEGLISNDVNNSQALTYYNKYHEQTVSGYKQTADYKTLPEDIRETIGRHRAEVHNKLIKYEKTVAENTQIINSMLEYLKKNDITPIVIFPPFSKAYLNNLNPQYKEIIYGIFENSPVSIEILDLNNIDIWTPEDFFDADHLNAVGADKASRIIASEFNLADF